MNIMNLLSNGIIGHNPMGYLLNSDDIDTVIVIANRLKGFAEDGMGNGFSQKNLEKVKTEKPEEFKKFIKVVCKVNGREYEETKYIKAIPLVTMEDIKITLERALNIKIDNVITDTALQQSIK